MANVTSDDEYDEQSDRFDSYSHSADISESECSSTTTFTCDPNAASTSQPSSPLGFAPGSYNLSVPPPVTLPVVDGRQVIISEKETDKDGGDMSGGGKGVCTALAISNAITDLAATVFGELWKLEPLAPTKKLLWSREMDWLLSVSDSIVELIPSEQEFPGGQTFEVMVTQQRSDIYVNLPALKKLDSMLISLLDGFSACKFYYVDRGVVFSEGEHIQADSSSSPSRGRPSIRLEEKWWLPFPKVPPNGLSEVTRKRLHQCREWTNQIFKAALAINTNVLLEMEVPKIYLESLPKSGRACLGEVLYRYIAAEQFSPEGLLDYLELSSEYTTLEIANRIEDAVLVWKRKSQKKRYRHDHPGRSSWGGAVKGLVGDTGKRNLLVERAGTLLRSLKLQFAGLPQTTLDMNKIQHNKDVGHSILESYSRVIESLAYNLMARVDDLLYVDDATKRRAAASFVSTSGRSTLQKQRSAPPLSIRINPCTSSMPEPQFNSSAPINRRRSKNIALA